MRRAIELSGPGCGFSLIELLVALAVFSLAVLALLNLAGENTRAAVVIEERVLAGVVAENRAVEAMIEPLAVLATATSGSEVAGEREWRWTREVLPTEDPGIVRIAINVWPAQEQRLAAELAVFRESAR